MPKMPRGITGFTGFVLLHAFWRIKIPWEGRGKKRVRDTEVEINL
jgi:hypothetical protein